MMQAAPCSDGSTMDIFFGIPLQGTLPVLPPGHQTLLCGLPAEKQQLLAWGATPSCSPKFFQALLSANAFN